MTADVELLPLPSVLLNWPHPTNHVAIRDYARANMEPLLAEIEALRAEVEQLQRQLRQAHKDYGCELRDPNGTIWEYAAMQRDRAERLAEALREAQAQVGGEVMAWRPIETAPLHSVVLVWSQQNGSHAGGVMLAYRRRTDGQWCKSSGQILSELEDYDAWPTHWMPTPQSPHNAPPSAPVGDSLLQTALRNLPQYISKSGLVGPDMHSAMQCFEVLRDALAQQPAAVDGAARRRDVRLWMRHNAGRYSTATELAEAADKVFRLPDGGLDNETHWVWDEAAEAVDDSQRGCLA